MIGAKVSKNISAGLQNNHEKHNRPNLEKKSKSLATSPSLYSHRTHTLTLTLTSILVGVHTLLTHVQRYDDGASVVIPLAVIARGVSEVAVSRAVGTAFVPRHQVGREVDVRELTVSVEVEVRSLEGGVGV